VLTEDVGTHASEIQGVFFAEPVHIKAIQASTNILFSVPNGKEIPLPVTLRIRVDPDVQVVFIKVSGTPTYQWKVPSKRS